MSYEDYDLPTGSHRYTISAVYPQGESVQAGPIVVETTVGIGEQEQTRFNVYPTHVTSTLTIESGVQGSVTLYNTIGQPLMTTQINAGSNTIDVSSLANGVYFIKSTQGTTTRILKF